MIDHKLRMQVINYCYYFKKKLTSKNLYISEQFIYKNISWKQKDKIKEKKSISINLLFLSSIYLLDNNMGCFHVFGNNS